MPADAQLEFMHLSQLSGEERYGKTAAAVIQVLHDKFPDQVGGTRFLMAAAPERLSDEGRHACAELAC